MQAGSFRTKAMSLSEARESHKMVADAYAAVVEGRDRRGRPIAPARPATIAALETAWSALVGDPAATGVVADAVAWTVPAEMIPMLRRSDSIPAAFAFVHLASELAAADVESDLSVRGAVRRAWAAFEQRRLEANHVEEGFGCDESASWHTLRDIVEGAGGEELKRKMLAIAELAGKMFEALKYTRKRVESDDPQEVRSTTIGGDIPRLLPAELAKLGNAATRNLTAMKVVKKQAQQFQMRGERTKSRGPLVLLLDESGSMHDAAPGVRGRNCWSKAAAIALTRVAWGENRPVRVVHFGNATVVQEIPRDDQDALWEMARSFLSGGTDITAALKTGRRQVGDLEKAGYKGADIVLITDGQEPRYADHAAQIDKMDADGIDLWTVAIGMVVPERAPIRARAERYVEAHDQSLASDRTAGEIVGELKGAALDRNRTLN